MQKDVDQSHDKMLARNRFLLLVVVGGAVLAIVSLSLQFCKCTLCVHVFSSPASILSGVLVKCVCGMGFNAFMHVLLSLSCFRHHIQTKTKQNPQWISYLYPAPTVAS